MIVITLSKVPPSLRGDLTKWCQEIQTGVYVGSFSARIREQLWTRINDNIGGGEATIVYSVNNEIGYEFRTTSLRKEVVYLDGIPLMKQLNNTPIIKHGFSNAAKFHQIRRTQKFHPAEDHANRHVDLVSLDIETTGIDRVRHSIISIGAVRKVREGEQSFHRLIRIDNKIPIEITRLTGITDFMLQKDGVDIAEAINDLKDYLRDAVIVSYNAMFDIAFLQTAYRKNSQPELKNKVVDLMPIVKKERQFLDNYRLTTVLKEYGIENSHPHDAVSDARATLELAIQLNEISEILT